MRRFTVCVPLLCVLAAAASAQDVRQDSQARAEDTQAYRILSARKAAAEAELEKMLTLYTRTFPAVRGKQYELDVIEREAARLLSTEPALLNRLSATYGDIVLRRIALEAEVRGLLTSYKPQHPLMREKLSALSKADGEALEHMR